MSNHPFFQNYPELKPQLDQLIEQEGFSHWGLSPLDQPLTLGQYKQWIEKKYHGEMKYLETHLPIKENPHLHFHEMKSAFVFAFPYFPVKSENGFSFPLESLRVAAYAKNIDYHFWIKEKLQRIISELQILFPKDQFIAAVDSSPLLERDLARRAGLGWIGKNTCLIHPQKGSLFFICEILSSIEIKTRVELTHDFCGNCTRCIDACPTKAIEEPHLLNANKCISYWTIESRALPPESLRPHIHDWFFGCDICQTVCPWNEKIFKGQLEIKSRRELKDTDQAQEIEELQWVLTSSGKQIQKALKGTPLVRSGPFGLRRNALLVIGNKKIISLQDEVKKFLKDPKLGSLAAWALDELSKATSEK